MQYFARPQNALINTPHYSAYICSIWYGPYIIYKLYNITIINRLFTKINRLILYHRCCNGICERSVEVDSINLILGPGNSVQGAFKLASDISFCVIFFSDKISLDEPASMSFFGRTKNKLLRIDPRFNLKNDLSWTKSKFKVKDWIICKLWIYR